MVYNIFYLNIYCCLWIIALILYRITHKNFGVRGVLLSTYTMIAICSAHLFCSPEYRYLFDDLTLFPFIYLFGSMLLFASPILRTDENKIKRIVVNRKWFIYCSCFILACFLFRLPTLLTNVQERLFELIFSSDFGQEAYSEMRTRSSQHRSQGDFVSVIVNSSIGLSLPFFFYAVYSRKFSLWMVLGLAVSAFTTPILGLLNGSRYAAGKFVIVSFFLFIFFLHFYSDKTKRKLKFFAILAGALILIPFSALTLSRSGGDGRTTYMFIERYVSEGALHFNNHALDANGTREGNFTAGTYKYLLGLNGLISSKDRLWKYRHMKMNESIFSTYVGDFCLDYGPFITIIIFSVCAFFFTRSLRIRDGTFTFSQYLIYYIVLSISLGFFQYPWGLINGNLELLVTVAVAILFHKVSRSRVKKLANNSNVDYESPSCQCNNPQL